MTANASHQPQFLFPFFSLLAVVPRISLNFSPFEKKEEKTDGAKGKGKKKEGGGGKLWEDSKEMALWLVRLRSRYERMIHLHFLYREMINYNRI